MDPDLGSGLDPESGSESAPALASGLDPESGSESYPDLGSEVQKAAVVPAAAVSLPVPAVQQVPLPYPQPPDHPWSLLPEQWLH